MTEEKEGYTGEGFTNTSYAIGTLEIRPTQKGDEYYIDGVNVLDMLNGYSGKHIRVTIQEVVEANTIHE